MSLGVLAAWVMWVFGSSATATPTLAYNMLRNGGFEFRYSGKGIGDGWTSSGEVQRTDAGPAQGGSWCLRVPPGETARIRSSRPVPVIPGWTYRAAFFATAHTTNTVSPPTATLAVVWLDSAKTPLPAKPWVITWKPGAGDWASASGKQKAPASAHFARLVLDLQAKGRALLCDDLYFGPEQPATTRFTPASFDAGALGLAQVDVGPTLAPPRVDGSLKDRAWKTAARLSLANAATGEKPPEATTVMLAYDPKTLYVGVTCADGSVEAKRRARDDLRLFSDDVFEVFLDFDGERDTDYYHFGVNAAGSFADARQLDPVQRVDRWTSHARYAVRRTDTGWQAELAFPFSDFPEAKGMRTGRQLRANFARAHRPGNGLSAWSRTGKSFHRPDRFGVVNLSNKPGREREQGTRLLRGVLFDQRGPRAGVEIATTTGSCLSDDYGLFEVSAPAGRAQIAVRSPAFDSLTGVVTMIHAAETVCLPPLKEKDPYRYSFTLPEGEGGWSFYATHYLEGASPDVPPRPTDRDRPLGCFLTPGETEPMAFTLFADKDLGKVRLDVSDLWDEAGHSIPSYQIKLQLVRIAWKRKGFFSSPTELLRMPGILDPYVPFPLHAGQLRQAWLTIHAAPAQPPGVYRGVLSIQPERGAGREVRVTVNVLPLRLKTNPYKRLGIYCRAGASFYPDLRAHGVELIPASFPYRVVQRPDGRKAIQPVQQEDPLQVIKQAGFTGPIPLSLRPPTALYDAQTGRRLRSLGVDEQRHWYQEAAKQVLAAVKERSLPPVVFYPLDEPFSHGKTLLFERWARWLKGVPGARVYVTTTVKPMQQPNLDAVTDVRCYHGWTLDKFCLEHPIGYNEIAHELRRSGDDGWMYYNRKYNYPEGGAEFTRLMNGFFLWQTPLTVSIPWTYLYFQGDPYDDLDGDYPEGTIFVYPNKEGTQPVPTIQWEAFREGWDDLRYLYTLEFLEAKAAAHPALRPLAKEADALLWRLRRKYPVGERTLTQMLARESGRDYDASRWELAQEIMKLDRALKNASDG